jgi:hypothetical protein
MNLAQQTLMPHGQTQMMSAQEYLQQTIEGLVTPEIETPSSPLSTPPTTTVTDGAVEACNSKDSNISSSDDEELLLGDDSQPEARISDPENIFRAFWN